MVILYNTLNEQKYSYCIINKIKYIYNTLSNLPVPVVVVTLAVEVCVVEVLVKLLLDVTELSY